MSNPAPAIRRPKSIALVDISYLFKKRYHTWDKAEHMGAAKATLRDLDNLRHGVEHVILCRDSPPYKRKELYPGYKAKRTEPEPEEIANRKFMYAEIKRLAFNCAWADGYEADDVMATLAKEYEQWCDDIRIVGTDKDMAQCINAHVKQYIPPVGKVDWVIRDAAAVKEKWGVPPELMTLYQALAGDDSDNLPKVKGIGPVAAQKLANAHPNLVKLANAWSDDCAAGKPSAQSMLLAANWDKVVLAFKLATLDTNVPLDTEGLLIPRMPEPEAAAKNAMDIPFDGYVGNETPAHPSAVATADANDTLFQNAKQVYEARFVTNDNAAPESATAAKDDALIEQEYERERQQSGEHDAVSNDPGDKAAAPAQPRKADALAKQATALQKANQHWGMVDTKLQPLDLTAAYTVSAWLLESGLYQQYKTTAQIFAVIVRGKELGLGMTTALAGHHVLGGKPVASADMLRALVERDPTFEYMYPKEMSNTRVVWVAKRKGYPEPVTFEYTIEDAQLAGLCKKGNYGDSSNWGKRPQDMLNKTAGSKLARLLWPAATLGLYCPEEMGSSEEELAERMAA
jgi:5'-3' exonuclease